MFGWWSCECVVSFYLFFEFEAGYYFFVVVVINVFFVVGVVDIWVGCLEGWAGEECLDWCC